MILVYASLVEAPFYLTLANRSVDILTVTGTYRLYMAVQ